MSPTARALSPLPIAILALAGCLTSTAPPCSGELAAWEDLDGDGYGGRAIGKVCELGAGEVEVPLDCDDTDESLNPDQSESCDGVDNDCDGQVDEDAGLKQFWFDGDGDGFGGDFRSELACATPGDEWVRNSDDCDDRAADVHPDALEVCGNVDEDCDGYLDESDDSVDPESFSTFYTDADGDGYGDPNSGIERCRLIAGYALAGNDCDDRNPAITQLHLWEDLDGDGYGNPAVTVTTCRMTDDLADNPDDCDDGDATVTIERDWYQDNDGDGYGAGISVAFQCTSPDPTTTSEAGDCDDGDFDLSPDAEEICFDGIDQDCNGLDDGKFVEDWESGAIGSDWSVGGDSAWRVDTTAYEGAYGSNNGNIGNNQDSFASITLDLTSAGTVSFWHSGDTENYYDYLRFKVDGIERTNRAGSWGWTYYSYDLTAGTHTLRWEYTKDVSVSTGSDTVWVDLIEVTGACN